MTISIDYASRQGAAIAACKEMGLDTVLVFAMGSCLGMDTAAQGYMSFLCGWDAIDSPSVLVLREGRQAWLLVASHRMRMMASENVRDADIEWADATKYADTLAATLAQGGDGGKRIGVLGWDEMPAGMWKEMEGVLAGRELVEVAPALAELRRVKDEAQRRPPPTGGRALRPDVRGPCRAAGGWARQPRHKGRDGAGRAARRR